MKLMEKVYTDDTELLEPVKEKSLYERDFYGWAQEQALLLKAGKLSQLDIDNLIEEVEGMSRSEKRELRSYLKVYFEHILKLGITWNMVLEQNQNGWKNSVTNAIGEVQIVLEENPSLKGEFKKTAMDAYNLSVRSIKGGYQQYSKLVPSELPKIFHTANFVMSEGAFDVDNVIEHFGFSSIESRLEKE